MTKFSACTIGVWGAAIACAGALAFALRPPVPPAATSEAGSSQHVTTMAPAVPPAPAAPAIMVELTPTLVVGRRVAVTPRQLAVVGPRCAPWRYLQQGAEQQQVRYCE